MATVALGEHVTPELEGGKDLGTVEPDTDYVAHYSDQPIASRLRDVFAALGKTVPPDLKLYDRFELWLIPHSFGLLRKRGFSEPVSAMLEIEYDAGGRTCSVVSMFPSFDFIQLGAVGIDIDLKGATAGSPFAAAELTASGELLPAVLGERSNVKGKDIDGLDVSATVAARASLTLNASVVTPIVSALGMGGTTCAWSFEKQKKPLFGCDLRTWSIVALSKFHEGSLNYRMRFSYRRRTLFFPTRVQGPWISVKCTLPPPQG